MSDSLIDVTNLSFSYGAEAVLADLSFSVEEGSILSIIGPNGSGKTTLLRLLLGILEPTNGSIRVAGASPRRAVRDIGYVPQRFKFDPTFPITVEEFLEMSAPGADHRRQTLQLSELGVEGLEDSLLGELSGGQLQRVLIAQAMLSDPRVIFLDEPASGIDIGGEKSFYQLIAHLRDEYQSTVVMVSHEVDVVARFSDQVLCLNRSMVCHGPPAEALTPEVLRELYGQEARLYPHGAGVVGSGGEGSHSGLGSHHHSH